MLSIDLKGASRNMDERRKLFERKEVTYKNCTEKAKERIETARSEIRKMHVVRAEREELIERVEVKLRDKELRIRNLEMKLENNRQSMRVEIDTSEEVAMTTKKLKEALEIQSEFQAKIIRAMRRKDVVEKQLDKTSDKAWRMKEKMKVLVDRLKFQLDRQEELKKSYAEKIASIKALHLAMCELEPKLRESSTRMRKIEVIVFELQDKINRKENEIRKIHKETLWKVEEQQRTLIEYEVKKGRRFRGPDALKQLRN